MTVTPMQAYVLDPVYGSNGVSVFQNPQALPFGVLVQVDPNNTRFYPWSAVILIDNPTTLPVTPVSMNLPSPLPVSLPAPMITNNALRVNAVTGLL